MPRHAKSDAVRIKELELLQSVLTNPTVTFVAAFATLEYLQKQKITGSVETSIAELAVGNIALFTALGQAVGPLAPALTAAGGAGNLLKALGAGS